MHRAVWVVATGLMLSVSGALTSFAADTAAMGPQYRICRLPSNDSQFSQIEPDDQIRLDRLTGSLQMLYRPFGRWFVLNDSGTTMVFGDGGSGNLANPREKLRIFRILTTVRKDLNANCKN
jgi:hypothetical protein